MSEITDMEKNFYKYLDEIEITQKNVINKVKDTFLFYSNHLCPETIQDIFITDYIEDSREYENLWFFSENYAMEAKNFISEDNFDISSFEHVRNLQIIKKDYDFENWNEESRIDLICDADNLFFEMRASKQNCDYLKDILDKYFIKRIYL